MSRQMVYFATLVFVFSAVSLAAQDLGDPTRPPGRVPKNAALVQTSLPKLTSILFGRDRRVAVIDGRVLREGSTVSGLTLVEVATNSVVVSVNGGPHRTLKLTSIHKERQ